MFKYTYGCSHTVQKPSISLWLFLDNARFIYLTIYPCLLLLFLTATRMERLVLFFQEPVAEAAQELRYFLTITLFCTLMILLDPIPLVTSLCYNWRIDRLSLRYMTAFLIYVKTWAIAHTVEALHLSLFLSVSLCLTLSLSVSVSMSLCLSVSLSLCLSLSLSFSFNNLLPFFTPEVLFVWLFPLSLFV